MSDEELVVFKQWECELLREASFYDGPVEPDQAPQLPQRIFEDRVELWEVNAIDGRGVGPVIPLGQVRRNTAAKFRLHEKYKGLYFVDGKCAHTHPHPSHTLSPLT